MSVRPITTASGKNGAAQGPRGPAGVIFSTFGWSERGSGGFSSPLGFLTLHEGVLEAGGSRAIVVSITDQGTGVVGARLRMLNLYGKQEGGTTLWGQEFVQMIKDPGQGATDPNTNTKVQSGFKDHGFGFVLGIDGGTPKYGWYGGAFTFYTGDVGELARDSTCRHRQRRRPSRARPTTSISAR